MTTTPRFLAVVEVPFEHRVRCSAEGCGHSVYRHIHVVSVEGKPRVFGSDCFARLFGGEPWASGGPHYGSREGRTLTADERALLLENTERLIAQFEEEAANQLNPVRAPSPPQATLSQLERPPAPPERQRRPQIVSRLSRSEAEAIARQRLERRYPGINVSLPGWVGLVAYETEDVLREHAA